MQRYLAICWFACLFGLWAPAGGAALRYDALGASDAVGIGASSPGANGQPNNGYVYLLANWLTARYPHWTLENRGVEGLTAPEIRDQELNPAILAQPDIVTLWAGANDVRVSIQKQETTAVLQSGFELAYTTILSRLRGETHAFIVTANIPDLSLVPSAVFLTAPLRQLAHDDSLAVNQSIARVAAAYGVPVIDLFSDPTSYDPANFWVDGFHPNDQGYLILAMRFEAVLQAGAWRKVSGLGDVNGDGVIDIADAAALLSGIGGMSSASNRQAVAGDVAPPGGDGRIDITDAVFIARRVAGLVPDGDWR
ncbi:MAG TPA: GDSL-type esterase/lipase family protein [Armatimonadota bacterium]|jgi:lysophospholipase L1-like esterase